MKPAALLLVLLCSAAGAAELGVVVRNAAGEALESAAVWLTPVGSAAPAATGMHVKIDQVRRRFVPLVTVLQAGTSVDFPNSDDIRHSVYSFSEAKPFTLKLYSGKPAAPVTFEKTGIVLLGCNIHDSMVAWVAVVDSPWFALSDASGRLVIKGVPEGQYRLQAWHPGQSAAFAPRTIQIQGSNEAQSLRIDAADLKTLLAPDKQTTEREHS